MEIYTSILKFPAYVCSSRSTMSRIVYSERCEEAEARVPIEINANRKSQQAAAGRDNGTRTGRVRWAYARYEKLSAAVDVLEFY